MNSIDQSEHMSLNLDHVLMKCLHWWKTLLFQMVDTAVVNILFQIQRKVNAVKEQLKRPQKHKEYSVAILK